MEDRRSSTEIKMFFIPFPQRPIIMQQMSLLQKANKPLKRLKESQLSLANPRLRELVNRFNGFQFFLKFDLSTFLQWTHKVLLLFFNFNKYSHFKQIFIASCALFKLISLYFNSRFISKGISK